MRFGITVEPSGSAARKSAVLAFVVSYSITRLLQKTIVTDKYKIFTRKLYLGFKSQPTNSGNCRLALGLLKTVKASPAITSHVHVFKKTIDSVPRTTDASITKKLSLES